MPAAEGHEGQALEPIFSASDGVAKLWVQAYQGEVLGEALFAAIAALLDDEERAHKLRVLAALERRTKEAVALALDRAGLSTDPDPEMLAAAEALAPASAGLGWDQLMASFGPITAQFLALYARIGELDPSERAAADLLVAHEEALAGFARAELAGDGAHALDAVEALPHMR